MTDMSLRAIRERWEKDDDVFHDDLMHVITTAEALREALAKIAIGDGYYGAQAREYKEIARAALRMADGEKHD